MNTRGREELRVSVFTMDDNNDIEHTESPAATSPPRPVRLPSARSSVALAAVMLAIGVAVGAAIGPGPTASLGAASNLAQRLPLLIAGIASSQRSAQARTATTGASTPSVTPQATPTAHRRKRHTAAVPAASPQQSSEGESTTATETTKSTSKTTKLPAISNVWLIELAGTGFESAVSQATAAPYIDGTLLPRSTLLSGWSAVQAMAFSSEAVLSEPPAAGATPPQLHTIVQPPCPEGAAGASCAPETPGQLTAADEFLKATLTTITNTPAYKEHGLVVVTFATVAIPTQSELPAGASSATLAYQPPAGVALLSPFTKAGAHSSASFDTTSPRRSLEALLR
jgi:hypothetical protein